MGSFAMVLVALAGVGLLVTAQATATARQGRAHLLAAERAFTNRNLPEARQHLVLARGAFTRSERQLHHLGPLLNLARATPLVRVQARAAQTFVDVGVLVADAGLQLADASERVANPSDAHLPFSEALETLQTISGSLHSGVAALDSANARVASLSGGNVNPIWPHRDGLKWPHQRARAL